MPQLTIYPSDDSYTDSGAATTNYGTNASLRIENSALNGYKNMFLKFSTATIPAGQKINSAILYLYVKDEAANLTDCQVKLCDADWAEGTIIYNGQPGVSGGTIHTFAFTTGNDWTNSGNVFATTVSNWYKGITNNYGITIRKASQQTGAGNLYSKEQGTTYDPYLLVTYEPEQHGFFFFMT